MGFAPLNPSYALTLFGFLWAEGDVFRDGWEERELEFVGSITAPLFWVFRDNVGKDQISNGSLFFMDAGEGVFAVTAAHVLEECLRASESPVFQCMIGGNGPGRTVYLQRKNEKTNTIDRLCDRIISTHHEMDIATLRVSQDEVELADRNIFTSLESSWPPNLVEVGAVACCGCPGEGRWCLDQDQFSFGFLPIGAFATSVHETCISIQIEREKFRPVFGNGIPENYDFGGMSGGPVLEICQTSSGQLWRRLAGVIFQGPNPSVDATESIQGLEIIRARPVHFINRNGSLDIARWEQSNG